MFLCGCKILPIWISQNCPSKCSRYRDCAQCKAFGTGKYSDDQCVELCPDVIMVDKLECECNTSYLNMPFWKRWTVVCIALKHRSRLARSWQRCAYLHSCRHMISFGHFSGCRWSKIFGNLHGDNLCHVLHVCSSFIDLGQFSKHGSENNYERFIFPYWVWGDAVFALLLVVLYKCDSSTVDVIVYSRCGCECSMFW